MGCLSDDEIVRLAAGRLSLDGRPEIERHLDACADCRRALAEGLRASEEERKPAGAPVAAPPDGPPALLPAGTRVGPFEIVAVLGVGASGVVYRARDPALGRDLAIKLLRPDLADREPAGWRERLLLEARAMARLNHPNVVVVYEAGTAGEQVFVAMELVEGETLQDWLRRPGRTWREILDVFLEVARGVAAAHDAGLVHGDLKPANVVVGTDGRPRITDFGLARLARAGVPGGAPDARPVVAGTPLYMAPEQLAGGAADHRSDQFAFCVALFEALYARHPFGGATGQPASALQLLAAARRGEVADPGEDHPVPRRIRDVLVRGLAPEPAARHPSMAALARALGTAARSLPRRTVRRIERALAAVGVAALALAAGRWIAAAPRCGNGVLEPGEQCDDGNRSAEDACLPTCRLARCGDGHVRAAVEECDDGNQRDDDGCTSACVRCPPGGATGPEGRCYVRYDTPATWGAARTACLGSEGDLLTIRAPDALAPALLGRAPDGFWTGLVIAPGRSRPQWVDDDAPAPAGPWDAALGPGAAGACFAVALADQDPTHGEGRRPTWALRSCDQPAGFVCEKRGWTVRPETGHAYRAVHDRVTWEVARDRCAAAGAYLVTAEDPGEHEFVAALAPGSFWMGGTDAENEGIFVWITGAPFVFQRFARGEPDDQTGDNDCLAMGDDDLWHDRPCWKLSSYVCEKE